MNQTGNNLGKKERGSILGDEGKSIVSQKS